MDISLRVLHVSPTISRAQGGPARSVQGLVAGQSAAGIEAWLLTLSIGPEPWVDGVDHFCNGEPFENVVLRVRPQLVHFHELWHLSIHRCVVICRRWQMPYIISPRGMLDPWALSVKRWKKIIGMALYQRADLQHAAALHATALAEARNIEAQKLLPPIIVSPNGVNLPKNMPPRSERRDGLRTALFLSRLHPGKGLISLAKAWAKTRPSKWQVVVVGPDRYGHKKEVLAELAQLGIADEWRFVDMVDDVEKWRYYRSADLLVHPSVSENFGITIAEGLAAELPVIATRGTPWAELEERKCGWWIDVGVEPLVDALKAATTLDDATLRAMGERGRKLIDEKYTWSAAARQMIEGYESVVRP